MKTKNYRYGKYHFKTYWKPVGCGYEVGLLWGKKNIFVGNFIHSTEAGQWWNILNREVKHFTGRYFIAPNVSQTFYTKFFAQYLYRNYYNFLDRVFLKHNRTYNKAFTKDVKRYNQLKKHWGHIPHRALPVLKAA